MHHHYYLNTKKKSSENYSFFHEKLLLIRAVPTNGPSVLYDHLIAPVLESSEYMGPSTVPMKSEPSTASRGELKKISEPNFVFHNSLPVSPSNAYAVPSPEPM